MAIDCMPRSTREAMLDGIVSNRIIVGAYTDGRGGVCPMLAAHRNGGRTNLASFARAWDAYTGAKAMREASDRELRTLHAMLEASLYYEEREYERARAAAEERRRSGDGERPDTGERDRTRELRLRPGWAWLRVFRRLDEWEDAVARAEREQAEARAAKAERELV